jgi:5-methylcytosine-specific restriction protein A
MRREFPKSVKLDAWKRAAGHCERCTAKLFPGHYDYDHDKPDAFGGEPTLSNCVVLCDNCHSKKTATEDVPAIAKSNRMRARHAGIRRKGRSLPGARASGWKRKMPSGDQPFGGWERR